MVSLFQVLWPLQDSIQFYTNFRISLSISAKRLTGIPTGIVKIDILTIQNGRTCFSIRLSLCVVCCCVTNYAKRKWLKTTFIISHLLWVRIKTRLSWAARLQGPLWLQLRSSARSVSSAGWTGVWPSSVTFAPRRWCFGHCYACCESIVMTLTVARIYKRGWLSYADLVSTGVTLSPDFLCGPSGVRHTRHGVRTSRALLPFASWLLSVLCSVALAGTLRALGAVAAAGLLSRPAPAVCP